MTGQVLKKITYLKLTIEQGTENVPDDGRFHIVHDGESINSAPSITIAETYLEMARDELLEANPQIKNARELSRKERSLKDAIASRAETLSKANPNAKGGRGGRGGV